MVLEKFEIDFFIPSNELQSQYQLLEDMSKYLIDKGYVKKSFINAIKEREKIFPTGLQIRDVNVALPHTDAEHVMKSVILVSVLKKPIEFNLMEDNQRKVPVSIVFMLAVHNHEDQLLVLQKLVNVFQKEGKLEKIVDARLHGTEEELEKEVLDLLK
ncbi:MAG TPA: PTS sugar transporter subunit IIA [Thermoanaerobacterales bacterium]|nr:PTS sugar transporter subunit IIA [Thermoanaerobacterales bacterium]